MAKKWYVIQTYSGFENRVKDALQQRVKEQNKEAFFGEILIPTETVQEPRAGGKARVRQKNSFPGYIFVEMEMTEEVCTWSRTPRRSPASSETSGRRRSSLRRSTTFGRSSSRGP